jgi:hypothetical protein
MKFNRSLLRQHRPALGLALASFVLSGVAGVDARLWVEATINGKAAHLIFDTGAGDMVLFTKGAKRLRLSFTNAPADVQLAPGEVPIGRTEECELQVGATKVRTSFGVLEVPKMLPFDCDGVLGWGPLANNIFMIDARQGALTCLTNIPGAATNWMNFALQTNSTVLEIEISQSGGEPSIISVDTGFKGGVKLAPDQWREWKSTLTNQPMTLDAYYMPGAGMVVAEEAWAKKLAIGSLLVTDVPVTEANKADVGLGSTGYQMTLGLAALKRLDFIIDGKRGIAYLHAIETPPPPYEHNRIGAVFTPVDLQSGDLIAHVVDGSPAWMAGIRNGDLLARIGKLDVTKWRTDPAVLPLSRFWDSPSGTKLELTLKRSNKKFRTEVVLQQILPPETNSPAKVSDE